MKRKLLEAAAVLGTVLGLVAFTPLGPAALAHLLERGVGGWQVSIGGREGGLIYGFSFSDLHCQNPALGVAVEVEHLAVRPWSWTIEVQAPKVRIEPRTSVDTTVVAADIELPIAFYPNLSATAGTLNWQLGKTQIVAQDWRGAYRSVADTSAHLELALSDFQGVPLRSLTIDLALSPHRIDRGEVRAEGISDTHKGRPARFVYLGAEVAAAFAGRGQGDGRGRFRAGILRSGNRRGIDAAAIARDAQRQG